MDRGIARCGGQDNIPGIARLFLGIGALFRRNASLGIVKRPSPRSVVPDLVMFVAVIRGLLMGCLI